MLAFATESFTELESEARPLTAAHWNEVEAPLHGQADYRLDTERYRHLETLNMLHVSAARTPNGTLAGYAAFTLVPCPHRPQTLLAALDGLYLAPQARGGFTALHLLRHAETALRQRGAGLVQYSSPASRPCDALYRRLGAHHTETVWHKEIR
ncbi:GNAT family N-acetyltransferase [Desulfovibrio falkowii]|uniref:GNAT family N-acetyltransferase n=1 Tax=Desulfovibrio sp. WGS1351 TaxID=3366814 RepID=UPI00372D33D8